MQNFKLKPKKGYVFTASTIFLALIINSSGAFAGLPSDIKKALDKLKLDAYGKALNKDFTKSNPPLLQDTSAPEDFYFNDSVLVGKTFQCKSFLIASNDSSNPPIANVTYQFSSTDTGSLFRQNVAPDSAIRYFTILGDDKEPENIKKTDVIGQTDNKNYYEKIRVSKRGDLIIEGATPEIFWAEKLLALIGLLIPDFNKFREQIDQALESLKLKVNLHNSTGMVVKYIYCPSTPEGFNELDVRVQKILTENLQH